MNINWDIIKWLGGLLATFGIIKIVWAVFRELFNKDNIADALQAVGEKCSDGAEWTAGKVRKKMVMAKQRREIRKAKKDNRPIVYIR